MPTDRFSNAIARRLAKKAAPGFRPPVAPKLDPSNAAKNKVMLGMFADNKKAYSAAKPNKTYKEKYIKKGGGFVESDFGKGNAGPGIPYQVAERDLTKMETPEMRKKRRAIERRSSKKKK